jgi:hypothetical protein
MAESQALQVQEKKELVSKGEKTMPARYPAITCPAPTSMRPTTRCRW